jgi:hypothetical protein
MTSVFQTFNTQQCVSHDVSYRVGMRKTSRLISHSQYESISVERGERLLLYIALINYCSFIPVPQSLEAPPLQVEPD